MLAKILRPKSAAYCLNSHVPHAYVCLYYLYNCMYRTSCADISSVSSIPGEAACNEVTELWQQVDMLQKKLAEVERAAAFTAP